jgi:non-specific protein-tyrosine kinase
MELILVAQSVLRRWWLVVGLALAGLVVAVLWSSGTQRRYESTVTLQLNPSARSALLPYGTESGGSSAASSLAASYAEVLRSRAFGEIVVRELGLSIPPEAVSGAISAKLTPNTNIFRLSVLWDNPTDAQQLAQAIAEIFVTENLRRQQTDPNGQQRLADMEETARRYQVRIDALRRQRDDADQAVTRGNVSRLGDLDSLDTRLTSLESSYGNLLVEISRLRSGFDTASILDNATPAAPVGGSSRSQMLLFGLLLGAAAGVGLAVFLQSLDDTLRMPEDVVARAGSAPLAVIGRIRTRRWDEFLRRSLLVTVAEPRSAPAEAFRTLRANLRFAATEAPFRTLAITSPSAHEGKTLIASNLAIAYAQAGDRVLLVDADLRRPGLHAIFGAERAPGLVDLLLDAAQQQDPRPSQIQEAGAPAQQGLRGTSALAVEERRGLDAIVETAIENLWLLPSGRTLADPSWVFGTRAVEALGERLVREWDLVIFDTAPIGPIADTLLLARQTDATILVARAGSTRPGQLEAAIQALRQAGSTILGIVLNDLRPGPLDRYSSQTYRYYYGYGERSYTSSESLSTGSLHAAAQTNGRALPNTPTAGTNGHVPEPPES